MEKYDFFPEVNIYSIATLLFNYIIFLSIILSLSYSISSIHD